MNSPLDLSLTQLVGAWEHLVDSCPSSARASRPGLEFVFCGLPVPFFNIAVATGAGLSSAALDELGRAASAWADPRRVPWFFVVTNEGLAPGVDAARALADTGLVPLLSLTGMLAEHVEPLAQSPSGLELGRPQDDAGCAAVLEINTAAYGMDLASAQPSLGRWDHWRRHVAVIGRANGTPVTCSAVMQVDGHHYVAFVATEPSQQRRGFADAAMRRSLDLAAELHGDRPSFLHATEAGRPVYERMGYRALATHTLFIDPRFLAGP